MTRNAASEAQFQASDPLASTWLSANAGSGKTKVLIDRVARLLLSGVSPQHILCLTYTKAAATEMQNRLFARLGEWAMMPEIKLRAALANLGDQRALDGPAIAQARQLFARAIESPGGLRIQTIHSFCATLLRRFPLEAGVSPAFQEMDDRAARLLRDAIIEELAETDAPEVVRAAARYHSGQDFLGLMTAIASDAAGFSNPLDLPRAKAIFDVPVDLTVEGLVSQTLLGTEGDIITALLPFLDRGGTNDLTAAKKLRAMDLEQPDLSLIAQLETVLLHGAGATKSGPHSAKLDAFPNKDARLALPPALKSQLDALMLRIEAARPHRIALNAAQKTAALHAFASAFLPAYQRAKAARGLLDFDDLIDRASKLLTDRSVAAWVLFRLDGGIDHILVDEAQDTSPRQWQVIESLAEEFTSGHSAAQRPRSLFVVGDKKQSIYSFQGADVAVFDDKRRMFDARFSLANQSLNMQELQYSFRSSPAILRVVDDVFGARFPRAMGDGVAHLAYHSDMAGRVDLWPVIEPAEKAGQIDPTDTAAKITAGSAQQLLADQVASFARDILASGMTIPTKDGPRAVNAGDILILVRKRSGIFDPIIRACKRMGLPIAGADRLRLGGELAVRDLTALLRFLATPEDDLSLAGALRSPLFGLDEAQLFDLAQGRKGYLWEALRQSGAHLGAMAVLNDLRDNTDYMRPYDLLERVLTRHDGRRRLIARLGGEAEEGIDEMLTQSLAYEQGEIPSLTGFLLWLDADEITIKRQVDGGGAQIRVMTVHGAKGLEAPIVVLPDTADHHPRDGAEIAELGNGARVWRVPKEESPPALEQARAAAAEAEADENLRLLYVALTRAQTWLIVAAAGKVNAPQSWYALVQGGMQAAGCTAVAGGILRHESGAWPLGVPAVQTAAARAFVLPDWVGQMAPPAPRPVQSFAPSRLNGPKTLAEEDLAAEDEGDAGAMALGTAVHHLLEVLPQMPAVDWPTYAARLTPAQPQALDQAARVLNDPALRWIFQTGLAEVGITASTDKGRLLGYLDRLIVTDQRVLAVDFKTNTQVPSTPAKVPGGLLAQMGAYHQALGLIYPNRIVDVAILWTKTATLMHLDHDMMRAAFHSAAIS